MIATPVFQGLAVVVISLFLIQLARRLSAQSRNPLAVAVNDATSFLTAG